MSIKNLINSIEKEAKKEKFPLDIPIYKSAEKEPTKPILYFGNLKSNICFLGRDLGRDEVMAGQPLIGAAGTLVRQGFYSAIHKKTTTDKAELESIKDRLILTNTVPYKPPENKAYTMKVKNRFRPYIEQLLVIYWQGKQIITLGTDAFKWFKSYGKKEEFDDFWARKDRYSAKLNLTLTALDSEGKTHKKEVIIYPLPHPSPLNQRYYNLFPSMFQHTLSRLEF